MIEMARRQLLPATLDYIQKLAQSVVLKNQIGISAATESEIAGKLSDLADAFYDSIYTLESIVNTACDIKGIQEQAEYFRHHVFTEMERMRTISDTIERMMPQSAWPIPTYSEMIYNV